MAIKWQEAAKLLTSGVGIIALFSVLFMLTNIEYTYSGDIYCEDTCESYINVTTSYWRVCFEESARDDVLYKKRSRSRTLWVNLNNVNNIISTDPLIEVDWLVPARGFGNWRPLKNGDCWDRRKINKIKLVGHKEPIKAEWGISYPKVKWSFVLGDKIDIDPTWEEVRMKYTPISRETIRGDQHTMTYFGNTEHVYEDGTWKNYRDAKNLKNKNYILKNIQDDEESELDVEEFNSTYILFKTKGDGVPLKIDGVQVATSEDDGEWEINGINVFDHNFTIGAHSTTVQLQGNDTDCEMTYLISGADAADNFGTDTVRLVGLSGGGTLYHGVIKWNYTGIPTSAVLSAVNMTIQTQSGTSRSGMIGITQMNDSFFEGNMSNAPPTAPNEEGSTWNEQAAIANVAWTNGGWDNTTKELLDNVSCGNGANCSYQSQQFLLVVQGQINTSIDKDGLMGYNRTGSNNWADWYSNDATQKPNFDLTYTSNTVPDNPVPLLNSTDSFQTNYTDEDLQCNFNCSDPDTGDTMTYDIIWSENDISIEEYTGTSCTEDEQVDDALLKSGNTSLGNEYKCQARIYDGNDYSNWVNSTGLTILKTNDIFMDSPTNRTYFTGDSYDLNVSSTGDNVDSWWYSNDSGANNFTFSGNLTFNDVATGSYNLSLWNNDTSDFVNFTSESFAFEQQAVNLTLDNRTINLFAEVGWEVNVSAYLDVKGYNVSIDIDHHEYGTNVIQAENHTEISFNVSNFRTDELNNTNKTENISFLAAGEETRGIEAHQYDLADSLKMNVSGFPVGGVYPTNVKIYVNNTLSNSLGTLIPGGDFELNAFSDDDTVKNTTINAKSMTLVGYFKIPAAATVTGGKVNLTGYKVDGIDELHGHGTSYTLDGDTDTICGDLTYDTFELKNSACEWFSR
jgi:hypothetical protein